MGGNIFLVFPEESDFNLERALYSVHSRDQGSFVISDFDCKFRNFLLENWNDFALLAKNLQILEGNKLLFFGGYINLAFQFT
jgi:hypothetical protein